MPPRLLLFALAVACAFAASSLASSSAGLMDISADGKRLACSNRDSGTVTIVDLASHRVLREIKVGKKPEGVSFLGPTHNLAVANYHDDTVLFLDGDTGDTLARVDVFDEPYGIVSTPNGSHVYVSLSYPSKVLEIETTSYKVTRTLAAPPFARGLAISPDATRLYVTAYHTAHVHCIDIKSGQTTDRWSGVPSDNLARQVVLHPTRPKAYVPHIRSATERAHGEGSIFPYVSILDTDTPPTPESKRWKRIPMDSFTGVRVTANPWEIALSPDARRLYVVFSGTNDLFVCDVVDDDYREVRYRAAINLGNNPRAVRVSPDNATFYIYNALDFAVVAYDAKSLRPTHTIPVTQNPLPDEILHGKRLFYSALQPMVGRKWISCSSCHPDGETDARTWQNPEGLRDTPPLAEMAWTHPLHWSADRDEVQDFEHTIRGNLMQGRGLIKGKVNPDLGPPNKGLSKDLDAVSAYSNTHKAPLSPHAKSGLSESARRGRAIFFSAESRCATCHVGPYFTNQTKHDVHTGPPHNGDASEKMGPAYDTPTLLGLYKSAPYLHDGKAPTLLDVLTTRNRQDQHGKTSHLSPAELADLVEFLKALPYEDPEPRARELGMRKIER